jgi:quercetin dioxygenase-like cupin family protein
MTQASVAIEACGPFARARDEGEAIWFFGELDTVLAPGERTGERLAVVEHEARRGHAPPWHRQPGDDETFYVLDGEITFWAGDREVPLTRATPGALVFVPRGTPHSFRVESPTARWLTISTAAGHERFYRAGGDAAGARTLPPEAAPDIPRVEAAGRQYGVELLGPPPG